MSASPRTPKIARAALVSVDPLLPPPNLVVFQYNPDQLTRSIHPLTAAGEAEKGDVLRLRGPVQETIKLDIDLDATDQLDAADGVATRLGLLPAISALETLVYPKAAVMIANQVLSAVGVIEVIPPPAPLTLLVWNAARIVPVRMQDFTITEEAFDVALNPIRAKASLSLRVLTYTDLGLLTPGGALFMAQQIAKEALAVVNLASAASSVNVHLPPGL
jgi:hypothetical protein